MTSQLNVDTIVDKAGSSGPSLPNTTTIKIGNTSTNVSEGGAVTQNVTQSLVKAWVHAHQEASQDSFNIASSADNGTGDFTFTFTNNFTSASTCPFGSNQSSRVRRGHYVGPNTSTFNIQPSNSSDANSDDNTSTAIAGDLA